MSRLTKEELMSAINQPMCFGSRLVGKKMFAQIIKELCEYKTIEEELGIDLTTLFKIYKNGFAYKDEKNKIKQLQPEDLLVACLAIQPECKRMLGPGYYWYFEDYGKTWALTKEELL